MYQVSRSSGIDTGIMDSGDVGFAQRTLTD